MVFRLLLVDDFTFAKLLLLVTVEGQRVANLFDSVAFEHLVHVVVLHDNVVWVDEVFVGLVLFVAGLLLFLVSVPLV